MVNAADETSARRSGRSAGERRRRWPWVLGGVLGLFVAGAVVVGVLGTVLAREAFEVRDDLVAARASIETLGDAVKAKDAAAIQTSADELTARTSGAADIVAGPLWDLAAAVPQVGANIDAVQRVTLSAKTLVDGALDPGLQIMSAINVENLALEGGGIDLEPFRGAAGSLPAIADAFAAAKAQTDPIDVDALLPAVAEPVSQVRAVIDQTAPTLDVVNRYLPTLLGMAGADGPRTYLLVFQNNAEIRATGGNPAASIIMTVDDGRFILTDQATSLGFRATGTAGRDLHDASARDALALPGDPDPLLAGLLHDAGLPDDGAAVPGSLQRQLRGSLRRGHLDRSGRAVEHARGRRAGHRGRRGDQRRQRRAHSC